MENTLRVYVTPKGEILLNEELLSEILSASQIKYLEAILLAYVRLCKAAGKRPFYKGTAHHEHVSKKHANKVEMLSLLWAIHGGKIALLEISEGIEKLFVEIQLIHNDFMTNVGFYVYADGSYQEPAKLNIEKLSAIGKTLAESIKARYLDDYNRGKACLDKKWEEWQVIGKGHTRTTLYDGPLDNHKASLSAFSPVGVFIRNIFKKKVFGKPPTSLQIIVSDIQD